MKIRQPIYRKFLLGLHIGLSLSSVSSIVEASSHREAPFITQQPKVDGTDFYMFRSYEPGRSGFVTLIANYQPLQDTYGGPNYFSMDQNALYEIRIDNIGDGKEHITYQFRFKNNLQDLALSVGGKKVSIPLVNAGSINNIPDANLNILETYTINAVFGNRRNGTSIPVVNAVDNSTTFVKPVDNIGTKSIPQYAAYAAKHTYNIKIPNCATPGRVFVGQRKDPFVVNLGEIFDLINIAAPATVFDPQAENKNLDSLKFKNVTSIEMEVPISCLTNGKEPVIGAWTTASVRQARLINTPTSNINSASIELGGWSQVSRLGMPLVNEVVIGLKDKDKFNASEPAQDGQFLSYVTHPTLPALIEILFSSAGVKAPTSFPRNDLVTTFLTGVPGLNKPTLVKASEMLRLNTTIAPKPLGNQSRLGVIGGDNAGFPNGRRPGDDIVDISLRVAMGRLCILNLGCTPKDAPSGNIDFTDGAFVDASYFDSSFPYLKTPIPGASR